MNYSDARKAIQQVLQIVDPSLKIDGVIGPKTRAAFEMLAQSNFKFSTLASSFADPSDIAAFKKCKAEGGYHSKGVWYPGTSDEHCFNVGDNGIGDGRLGGLPTIEGSGPSCALTPEDIKAKWGTVSAGKGKFVKVTRLSREVICQLKDTKGHENSAGIDLNPDAVAAIGLTPPIMEPVFWEWA